METGSVFAGPPDDFLPGTRTTRREGRIIAEHHTDGAEAGRIFERVKPKCAVFSHYNVAPGPTLASSSRRTQDPSNSAKT